jgi:hypothetical protein
MIHEINRPVDQLLNSKKAIEEYATFLKDNQIVVARKQFDISVINKWKEYLSNVGRNSLPNYFPIENNAPNSHRINDLDERAYVKGSFHQFSFYPWNQDFFNFFDLTEPLFRFKNLLSGLAPDSFLSKVPENGFTARLSFQFYPAGRGMLSKHRDPVDVHQICLPILIMSSKGSDFMTGGAYVELPNQGKVFLEEIANPGDVVFFKATLPHGVDAIDPDSETEWLSFKGRWMLLLAINKLSSNTNIGNAEELDS